MQYYVFKNNEQIGPLPLLEVRERLQKGDLAYTDLAWREGMQDWSSLLDLMGGALPDALPHALTSSTATAAPKATAPTVLRLVTSVVVFIIAFAVIAVCAWVVASFICAVSVAAQMAIAQHAQGQGTSAYIQAGEDACKTYFAILAGSAALFALILSPVVAWMTACSNLFPWCRAR